LSIAGHGGTSGRRLNGANEFEERSVHIVLDCGTMMVVVVVVAMDSLV